MTFGVRGSRAGQFVETGMVDQVLHQPEHAYTRELLAAVPALPVQCGPGALKFLWRSGVMQGRRQSECAYKGAPVVEEPRW